MSIQVRTAAELGRAVRELRKAAGLTQVELAALARVSRRWLIRLEQGHHAAEISKILDVCRALDADIQLVVREPLVEPSLSEVLGEGWE